jgi:hypothetical protein
MSNFIPTATEIKNGDSSTPVIIAVPIPETYQGDDTNIVAAPTLKGYDDDNAEAQDHEIEYQARIGQNIGMVNAHQERQNTRDGDYQSRYEQSVEKTRITNANDIARQRDSEGLEMKGDAYFDAEAFEMKEAEQIRKKKEADFDKLDRKQGYAVQEYDVAEYNSNDYESSSYEYKSVYD